MRVPEEELSFTQSDHCSAEDPLGVGTGICSELEGRTFQDGRCGRMVPHKNKRILARGFLTTSQ